MVPCPENTPLPSRRVSKDARAKFLSIYLRPWTMSPNMATAEVPFILDLAQTPSAVGERDVLFRGQWKRYLGRVLPHAERGVRSFMLTCLAEGRSADDDDENDKSKGPAVVCDLNLEDVHAAVALSEKGTGGEE